jgi:hypothetical protein
MYYKLLSKLLIVTLVVQYAKIEAPNAKGMERGSKG